MQRIFFSTKSSSKLKYSISVMFLNADATIVFNNSFFIHTILQVLFILLPNFLPAGVTRDYYELPVSFSLQTGNCHNPYLLLLTGTTANDLYNLLLFCLSNYLLLHYYNCKL